MNKIKAPLNLSTVAVAGYKVANAKPKLWPIYGGGSLVRDDVVTSSEIGYCERMIKFNKMGSASEATDATALSVPGGLERWGFAERGNVIEEWLVDKLHLGLRPDYTLMHAGRDQVSFVHDYRAGTPDGLLRNPDYKYWVVEIKSIDPRTNRQRLPKPAHYDQLQNNIDLVNLNGLEALGGVIFYISASDLEDHHEFWYSKDDARIEELREKAKKIHEARWPSDLTPEGLAKDAGCDFCNHTHDCSDAIRESQQTAERRAQQERIMKHVFNS